MRQRITLLDGAMGTVLQAEGLDAGERLETLCVTSPERVERVHRQYVRAGADMILASKAGFLFRTTEQIKADYPQLPAFETYDELFEAIQQAMQ